MLEKLKRYGAPVLIVVFGLACFFYGRHVANMAAEKTIAEIRRGYAEQKTKALEQAESMRKAQEEKYLEQIDALKRANANRAADALRVRQQFEKRLSGNGDTDIEQCNQRASRCERLLSEAYELAAEGEGLLADRDARLKALQ